MEENQTAGTAGPALAAHSKDSSAPGPTPASSATANKDRSGDFSETASRSPAVRQSISEQGGRAADQVAEFIREQPLVALAIMGAACLTLGFLLARH